MIQINIKATETEVTVTNKTDRLTSGNVNQIQCVFDLSEAFKGLVVRAVFNGKFSTVENGMCYAPELEEGRCRIGVYAYEVVDGKTSLRLSPIPCIEYVYQGTYDGDDVKADKPTPSELESHYALIKEMVDSGVLKGDKGDQGPSGPQGEQGLPGKDGKDGTDGVDGKSAYELAVAQGYQGSIDEWLESLKGIQARTILDVSNGIDFDSLEDGAYDIKGSFKLFNNTIPLNTGDILIKDEMALTIICSYGSYYIVDYNDDNYTIANSYLPTRIEVDEAIDEAQTKTEEAVDDRLSEIKNKFSNILEFKLITTEEEYNKTFSFSGRVEKHPNYNCQTRYAVLNSLLGAEDYPSNSYVELIMTGTDPEVDITKQMKIIGQAVDQKLSLESDNAISNKAVAGVLDNNKCKGFFYCATAKKMKEAYEKYCSPFVNSKPSPLKDDEYVIAIATTEWQNGSEDELAGIWLLGNKNRKEYISYAPEEINELIISLLQSIELLVGLVETKAFQSNLDDLQETVNKLIYELSEAWREKAERKDLEALQSKVDALEEKFNSIQNANEEVTQCD